MPGLPTRSPPLLSVVTPTVGRFSERWLERLLALEGDVEFVLAYPPATVPRPIDDPRVRRLTSPFRGELMQRLLGLLNADGAYVLALDDDDFVHPAVAELTASYFGRFPASWVLRLRTTRLSPTAVEVEAPWEPLPEVAHLPVTRPQDDHRLYNEGRSILEVPICPLTRALDPRLALMPRFGIRRRDMHGLHMENFNNRVWRSELVRATLPEVLRSMQVRGALHWIPSTGFDRVLSLFIQARFFQPELIVGHWMPLPPQVRVVNKPSAVRYVRFHAASHGLLVRAYPRFGYLWNVFLSTLHGIRPGFKRLASLSQRSGGRFG